MQIALVWKYKDTNLIMWRCSYTCTTRRERLGHKRDFFFCMYHLSQQRNREYDPDSFLCRGVCVCVCVCTHVWATCSHYARRAYLMAIHSLTFTQTSCRYIHPQLEFR